MTEHWIRCGVLVTGTGEPLRRDAVVHVVDGVIAGVHTAAELPKDAGPGRLVDHSTATVVPGFVDAHVHLLFTCDLDHERTRAGVENSTPAALALIGARSATECLLGGVTTVRDCGDIDYVTLEIRDAVNAGRVPGPRILAAGPPITTTGGHLHWCGNAADSVDEIRKATRRLCTRGVDVIKVMASGGNMTRGSNKLQPQFQTHEMRVVVEEAHRLGRRVAAHALNTESIRRAVAAGVDTLEHCIWVDEKGAPDLDLDLVDEMARLPVSATLTMAGIARVLLPDADPADAVELGAAHAMSATGNLYDDFAFARTMRTAGVHMSVASDAGVRFTPFREFGRSVECTMEALGLSYSEAIAMSTLRSAESLGLAGQIGSIEVGKAADLVVLDGLANEATRRIAPIRQVWRDGAVVIDGGRVAVLEVTS
ncbi:amidohydrolase family protein [Sphaerisporangium perillae]|uniref:amidohydrolase family protein n=1 Tax=Sphaerisporangium perillae TaxID=2935860 RepID=UPI00200C01BD|nr:amidohydrolase family protein [Sphaerisporangium perillae]